MKMAPILEELRRRGRLTARLIHTGQHLSPEMSDDFFRDLDMPLPDESLVVPPSTPVRQIAAMLHRLEGSFAERRPAAVVVVGDVNACCSGFDSLQDGPSRCAFGSRAAQL
jgi:UDP-N-acetylglucosamine 2-epimerase (non-hydrolysing)